MAQVIEFYVPQKHSARRRWKSEEGRGKVMDFPVANPDLTSAWMTSAAVWAMQPWSPAPVQVSTHL